MDFLNSVAAGVLARLIAEAILALGNPICRCLVKAAVLCLPKSERQRFQEEWLAHLNEVDGLFGKIGHAFNCVVVIVNLRAELLRDARATKAASSPSRSKS